MSVLLADPAAAAAAYTPKNRKPGRWDVRPGETVAPWAWDGLETLFVYGFDSTDLVTGAPTTVGADVSQTTLPSGVAANSPTGTAGDPANAITLPYNAAWEVGSGPLTVMALVDLPAGNCAILDFADGNDDGWKLLFSLGDFRWRIPDNGNLDVTPSGSSGNTFLVICEYENGGNQTIEAFNIDTKATVTNSTAASASIVNAGNDDLWIGGDYRFDTLGAHNTSFAAVFSRLLNTNEKFLLKNDPFALIRPALSTLNTIAKAPAVVGGPPPYIGFLINTGKLMGR